MPKGRPLSLASLTHCTTKCISLCAAKRGARYEALEQIRQGIRERFGVRRPQFSWTRIKGESDVKGGGGHGWVEEGAGSGVGADGAAVGAGALAPGQRWSASRKRDVVLRLLRGESLEMVSREVGVELYRLEAWQARTLAGLGLKAQAGEPLAAELDAAKRHIGELSMEIELLRERARAAECRLPLATRRSRR